MRHTLLASATLRRKGFAASRDVGSPGLHRPPHRPQSHPSHGAQSQSKWSSNQSRSWPRGRPRRRDDQIPVQRSRCRPWCIGRPPRSARSSPPAPSLSLPSAWSLHACDASHSTSSLAPLSRSPYASSLPDDSRWLLLCPSRTDGAHASYRRAPCLWAHDGKMVPTPHSVWHLVCGRSTEQ